MDWQGVGTLFIGGIMAWQWYSDHKAKRVSKPDLSDPDYDDVLSENLHEICKTLEAMRVSYWAFTNGTMTADGYSMKNLSMMAESNRDGVDSLIREMQNIPCINFKRNLTLLRDADSLIVCHEHDKTDTLGRFHQYYGFNTCIFVKVFNGGKWTGIIGLNFEDKNIEFTEQHLAWLSVQSSVIGAKLKSFTKK